MTTRRGFIGGLVASLSAPAIVRPESLMKLFVPARKIIMPPPANKMLTSSEFAKEVIRVWLETASSMPKVDKHTMELLRK